MANILWMSVIAVVKFQSAQQTGLSAACLCINRRLAIIASYKRVDNTASSKRIAFWTDIAIVTLPSVMVMVVSYLVQSNRYNILEGFGCLSNTWWELYAILGLMVPPIVLGLVSFAYGGQSASFKRPCFNQESELTASIHSPLNLQLHQPTPPVPVAHAADLFFA
jgi:pheromone a factor receptor